MAKSNKIPPAKSPDPQPTPQAPKVWNMQDGNKAHQGDIPHVGERYEGDVGDNPKYSHKNDDAPRGAARRNDDSHGVGLDAVPSPSMDYFPAGSQLAPDRTSHRRVPAPTYQQGATGIPDPTWLIGSSTPPPKPTE